MFKLFSKEKPKKAKIVLSGSGTLYPAHAGALLALHDLCIDITHISGVSGGAIIAAMYASGIHPKEIINHVKNLLPGENCLIDYSWWPFKGFGFIKGDKIEAAFRSILVSQFKFTKIPLNIIALNLNRNKGIIFSTEHTPDQDLSDVVRASISLPGVFKSKKIGDDYYVDGGMVNNFPVDIYENHKDVIGLNICSSGCEEKREKVNSVKDFMVALVDSIISSNSVEQIEDAKGANIINLYAPGESVNFNMDKEQCSKLIKQGYDSVINYYSGQLENNCKTLKT